MTGAVAALSVAAKAGVVISTGPGGTYEDQAFDPSDASCTLAFELDGDIQITRNFSGSSDIGDWMSPKLQDPASNYELRVDPTSGTFSSGTTGAWLLLSSTRSYSVARTTGGTKSCTATYQIRRASDQVVLSSVSYTLIATVEV
jgi:hypothetical protein